MTLITRMAHFVAFVLPLGIATSVARADGFTDHSSWECYDAKNNDPPGAQGRYVGAVLANGYVYFAPKESGNNKSVDCCLAGRWSWSIPCA